MLVDAGIEQELKIYLQKKRRNSEKDRLAREDDGINNLIKKGYELLNLITYFTTGFVEETRAWTIVKGWTAP